MAALDININQKQFPSRNEVRAFIRGNTVRNKGVLSSLQSCKLKENLDILENKIVKVSSGSQLWEHLRGLRAILDCLLANVTCSNGSTRVKSYIEFDEAYHLYLSYCTYGSTNIKDTDQKKRFKELLLHPEFGLCVYLVTLKGNQFVILKPNDFDLEDVFLHLFESGTDTPNSRFILDEENVQALYQALDTEWDKKVLRVILGATRSRAELDALGIDSDSLCTDERCVFGYLEQLEDIEKEAASAVAQEIDMRIEKKESLLHSKEKLLSAKEALWSKTQIEEENENIEDLRSVVDSLKKLKEEKEAAPKKHMLNRCKKNIIRDRRLKLRKLGSGRKRSMDEIDEQFLVESITEKATAHGRRHDSVMYLNHRVKKKDFLRIVNFNRKGRELPPIKSMTTPYNRSRPKSKRSLQAKKHCGLGLFCCKKPPKAEDNSGILTHFCRAQKKNIVRSLSETERFPNQNYTLYRSFDDKAYLCPGTGTGMTGTRAQKIYQPDDPTLTRKLPKYDFPECMVNCTPGTFLFMNKQAQMVDNEESIKTCDQQTVVVTKPKYFVGSSGTVWASHLMDIKHREPSLYEAELPPDWQSKSFRSIMSALFDDLQYFTYQFDEDDLQLITNDLSCPFRSYEMKKAQAFEARIDGHQTKIQEIIEDSCEMEIAALKRTASKLNVLQETIVNYRENLSDAHPNSAEMKNSLNDCLDLLREIKLPRLKSRIVDLTDAGPGVGITNHEVKFRSVEETRLMKYDYYVRHHLAPGDSSHNEVERIQSYVGDAVCDGGALNWEYKKKSDLLPNLDVSTVTTLQLEELELERMKFNAFQVAKEVSDRIDCAVAPDGFMKSFVTSTADKLFYWDKPYLTDFIERKNNSTVPGHNYFSKLESFSKNHVRTGNKYFEIVKFACEDNGDSSCSNCPVSGWVDTVCQRIPEPMPDHTSNKWKYLHVKDTPNEIDGIPRPVDDFNPRVQLRQLFQQGVVKNEDSSTITSFSERYIVDESTVKVALDDLIYKHITKEVRKRESRIRRETEKKQGFDDINWLGKVEDGSIKNLLVETLNKYLLKYNMMGCLKLKKTAKILVISRHVKSQGLHVLEHNIVDHEGKEMDEENDSELSDDDMDEIINCTTEGMSESDLEDEGHEPSDVESQTESLFVTTRSGRIAGNWRLSSYIAASK